MVFGMVLEGRQLEYVNPLGPAFLSRLQAGDVIIAVDGEMLGPWVLRMHRPPKSAHAERADVTAACLGKEVSLKEQAFAFDEHARHVKPAVALRSRSAFACAHS